MSYLQQLKRQAQTLQSEKGESEQGLDIRFRDDFDASGWTLWDEQVRTLLLNPAAASVKAVA